MRGAASDEENHLRSGHCLREIGRGHVNGGKGPWTVLDINAAMSAYRGQFRVVEIVQSHTIPGTPKVSDEPEAS